MTRPLYIRLLNLITITLILLITFYDRMFWFSHPLISYALKFYYVPGCIKTLVASYFEDLRIWHSSKQYRTCWQQLGTTHGTPHGHNLGVHHPPVLFTATLKVIWIAMRTMTQGVKNKSGQRMLVLGSHINDVMSQLLISLCMSTPKNCQKSYLGQ